MTKAAIDPAVLEAFRRGDDDAVRVVYERYSGPVFTVALSVLGDRDLAAEAVQETFVRAWRGAARYNPRQELAPWLYAIVRRTAIDIWRSRRRESGQPPDDDTVVVLPRGLDSVWEAYQVRLAVDRLPSDEREVVLLQHFVQLSHTEIAARLGIPIGTVKSRSHRGHRRLARWLRPLCTLESEPIDPSAEYLQYSDSGAGNNAI